MRAISSDFRLERVRKSRELLFELVNYMSGGPAGMLCKLHILSVVLENWN